MRLDSPHLILIRASLILLSSDTTLLNSFVYGCGILLTPGGPSGPLTLSLHGLLVQGKVDLSIWKWFTEYSHISLLFTGQSILALRDTKSISAAQQKH